MRRRGFTLPEIFAAMFLLGILGLLVIRFLLPIVVSSNRMLAGISAAAPVEQFLNQLHADTYQASRKGLSFTSSPDGEWTLALVRRTKPSSEAEVFWEKDLRVYRYHPVVRELTFQKYTELKWPDGSLRLNGQEPLHFSKDELAALPSHEETVVAHFVKGNAWADLGTNWEFDYLPPDAARVHYLLSLAGDLD